MDLVYSKTYNFMGTSVTIKVSGLDKKIANEMIEDAAREIEKIEFLLNPFREGSEIWILNKYGVLKYPSEHLLTVLERALKYSEVSQGAFDITAVSTAKDVTYRDIALSREEVRFLKKGVIISLGGIAKGYAVDRAIEVLKRNGVQHGLVDAGGDIRTIDGRGDGKAWRIGVRNPFNKVELVAILKLSNKAVATSGVYERSNVMNPRERKAVEDPVSATVISNSAMDADALATLSLVSPEIGLNIVKRFDSELMLIRRSGEMIFSDGFKSYILTL